MTITGDFERFHYFTFETSFLENEDLFKTIEYERTVIESNISVQNCPAKNQCLKRLSFILGYVFPLSILKVWNKISCVCPYLGLFYIYLKIKENFFFLNNGKPLSEKNTKK